MLTFRRIYVARVPETSGLVRFTSVSAKTAFPGTARPQIAFMTGRGMHRWIGDAGFLQTGRGPASPAGEELRSGCPRNGCRACLKDEERSARTASATCTACLACMDTEPARQAGMRSSDGLLAERMSVCSPADPARVLRSASPAGRSCALDAPGTDAGPA